MHIVTCTCNTLACVAVLTSPSFTAWRFHMLCCCRFKKYLSNLSYLIDQEGDREELEFEWSSPMSGRPGRFFRIAGFRKEHALVRAEV